MGAKQASESRNHRLDQSACPVHQGHMRTEQAPPVRLQDYRPPDWLIETVDLDVSLDPSATTVRARLKLKPNGGATPAPLVLDGEELNLKSLKLDGKPLPTENFVATPDK